MEKYQITCCSTADLSKEHFEKIGVKVIYFHFQLDGKDYLDDMGESVPPSVLFEKMFNGAETKTSQVTVGEYVKFFTPFLENGEDILHLTLSSGISGTINSAELAKRELQEKYPQRKIFVVDSLAASSGYGLLVDILADFKSKGMPIEEVYEFAENQKLHVNHWFYTTDLTFFIRGGRISKAAGVVGQVLEVCPLLNVDFQGKLIPREKIRGKRKVMKRCLQMMIDRAENGTDYDGKCFISHSDREEEAKELAEQIKKTFPKIDGDVKIYPIGATIGSHTGPGTIALFFWGEERVD